MSWFSKIAKIGAGWAANPIIGSVMAGKEILGLANKIPSRGYDANKDNLNKAYDLYDQNKNAYDEIYDPRLRDYQMQAMNRLQGIAGSKELDAESQSQLNKIRQHEGQLERGSREAIMQNAAERGASSSTGNLMAQLMNQQGASERRTNQDTDVAAMQQKRALDALYSSVNTARGIGDQDYRRAQANNLFNQYNIGGKAGVLGAKGQNEIDKAQAQNDFWGGIIKTGVGMAAGGPAGAAAAGMGSGSPIATGSAPSLGGGQFPWQLDPNYFNYRG